MADSIVNLTTATFDETVNGSSKPVIVDCVPLDGAVATMLFPS